MDDSAAKSALPGLNYEPDEIYVLEDLEQVRAAATLLRVQILDCLGPRARTVREVGQILDISSNKLYYHVGELERVGLVRLVHTEVQAGIQQKYYRARAHYYFLSPDLLRGFNADDRANAGAEFITSQLDKAAHALRSSYLAGAIGQAPEMFRFSRREVRMSSEQAHDLSKRIRELDQLAVSYEDPKGDTALEMLVVIFPQKQDRPGPE